MLIALALCVTTSYGINPLAATCEIGQPDCIQCREDVDQGCQCGRGDYGFWLDSGFYQYEAALETCATRDFGVLQAFAETADDFNYTRIFAPMLDCLEDNSVMATFTKDCNGCFANITVCTFEFCRQDCFRRAVFSDSNGACSACVLEKCEAPFGICSGLDTENCPQCTKPEEPTIIPGVPDIAFFFGCCRPRRRPYRWWCILLQNSRQKSW